jgi:hypothetical protein
MKNEKLEKVKHAIRNPYAWPGGYPVYTVMSDGGMLCPDCAKSNFKLIAKAILDQDRSGWCALGATILWEGTVDQCCNCNKDLESAYGED